MENSGEPELIRNKLRELSDADFVRAAKRFLDLLKNKDSQYVPSSFSKENLYNLARKYFDEYRPLFDEANRRQAAGIKGVDNSAFAGVYRELRGKMPEELTEEWRDFLKRQIGGRNWDPAVDGKRLKFLQGISDFYQKGGELPFSWLIFLLDNKENIAEMARGIGKKQTTSNLSEEETLIFNFLNRVNRGTRGSRSLSFFN